MNWWRYLVTSDVTTLYISILRRHIIKMLTSGQIWRRHWCHIPLYLDRQLTSDKWSQSKNEAITLKVTRLTYCTTLTYTPICFLYFVTFYSFNCFACFFFEENDREKLIHAIDMISLVKVISASRFRLKMQELILWNWGCLTFSRRINAKVRIKGWKLKYVFPESRYKSQYDTIDALCYG